MVLGGSGRADEVGTKPARGAGLNDPLGGTGDFPLPRAGFNGEGVGELDTRMARVGGGRW